jgi:patatin-related protein
LTRVPGPGYSYAIESPPAVSPVPAVPVHADTAELRLALVCYGGVSLAIYMHGVTKEIQKLVAASKAYEQDQESCEFTPGQTEWAYWQALKEREKAKDVRTRVVVDVIAGTSAGGINGIVLAKSIAHDLPQDALRKVWIECGDIRKLMGFKGARFVPSLPLKVAAWMGISGIKRRFDPPLDGDRMFGWVHDALGKMDKAGSGDGTLMPEQHPLELYVTVTDFYGYYRGVPIHHPKRVKDRRHRHVLVFSRKGEVDQLGPDWNAELSFAARATSCFPGAFPPINLANIEHNLPGWRGAQRFKETFWSIYPLSRADVDKTHFVDGGVLDNFPFRHAIDAIRARPASLEVDRRLIYIEPHPADQRKPPTGVAPKMTATVGGGLSGLPRHEPILDDLLALREFNERVERVNDVVEAARDRIFELAPPPLEVEGYAAASQAATELAKGGDGQQAGFAYTTYTALKLRSVVERFADLACDVLRFPPDSNHAFFVHDVLAHWAAKRGLLAPAIAPTDEQIEFLKTFDLGYAERRLRFVVRHLNRLYGTGEVERARLNAAKATAYEWVAKLSKAAAEAGAGDRGDPLRELFEGADPDEAAKDFVDRHGSELDGIRDALRSFLDNRLGDFGKDAYGALLRATDGWDDGVRRQLLARYVGFPMWDVLIFPISAVSDVGELNRVEVVRFSPEDVSNLKAPKQKGERPTTEEKLKGVTAGHFAAFFSRDRRENDYLWGRLDAAERLIYLLLEDTPDELCHAAFRAVLDQEEDALKEIPELIGDLRGQLRAR